MSNQPSASWWVAEKIRTHYQLADSSLLTAGSYFEAV